MKAELETKYFKIAANRHQTDWKNKYVVWSYSREAMTKLMNSVGYKDLNRSLRYSDSLTAFVLYTSSTKNIMKYISVIENPSRPQVETRRLIPWNKNDN